MIALPREAFQRIFPIEKKTQFRERRRQAHQETYPRVLILAASRNMQRLQNRIHSQLLRWEFLNVCS